MERNCEGAPVAERQTIQKYQSPHFDTNGAAAYLVISPSTLTNMRVTGAGPMFIKLGRRVVYARSDLDAWVFSRKRTSTSDTGRGR